VRSKIGHIAVALFIATTAVATSTAVASASTAGGGTASGCGTSALPAFSSAAATSAPTGIPAVETVGAYKAAHDTQAATLQALAAANVAHDTEKTALINSGQLKPRAGLAKQPSCRIAPATSASRSANAVVAYLAQYAQVNGAFCGPATVSEFSATVPGSSPYNLNQWTVAAYMDGSGGSGIYNNGTNVSQEVNGLNHFVGAPDFGRNYYGFVGMSYTPTAADRSGFEAHLDTDVSQRSPVAGDAWEVAGGPHLVGHPVNQTIFHWFEIGGRSGSSSYYADSATSVWGGVPRYSWYSTYTLETILGGRGYIW
jgi:hypothetical protein